MNSAAISARNSPRRPARDTWFQGQADAEQIPECRELLVEVEAALESPRQKSRLVRLARATRSWLNGVEKGRGTVSVLAKHHVAMPANNVRDAHEWHQLLAEGEDNTSLFPPSGCSLCGAGYLRAGLTELMAMVLGWLWKTVGSGVVPSVAAFGLVPK